MRFGRWEPFRPKDKPWIPGQESDKVFSKEGLIIVGIILIVLVIGGVVCTYFFGPRT